MTVLEQVLAPVKDDLAAMEDFLAREMRPEEKFLHEYLEHVSRFRGKRLRPALVFLAARAFGKVTPDHLRLAAVAELLHTATLVHDDILDEALVRRKHPTAHRLWGNELTVLLGDYLFARAYELACDGSSTAIAVFLARTARSICVGEMQQIRNRGNLELGEPEYLAIIEQKTASLYSACGYIGAHEAGAPPEAGAAMAAFGREVGMAFQIADDLLDLTGDEKVIGKTLGTDVGHGKLTLPVIRMLHQLPEPQRSEVRAAIGKNGQGAPWRHLLGTTGALDYARDRAAEFTASARARLSVLDGSPVRPSLEALTRFVVSRDA